LRNTAHTGHVAKSDLKTIQQQLIIYATFSVKALHEHEPNQKTESRSMQEPVSETELADSEHVRGLSSFFAQTAMTKPLNITTRITTFGGQLSRFARPVMPNGTS